MTRKGKEKDDTKPDRATWSSEMEKLLINALLVEIQAGRKAENGHGMTKEGWTNAHAAFNKYSKQPLELMQIKNKANALKKEYAIFSAIKDSGIFTWDDTTGTPTAPNDIWDRYIESNPTAKKYRGRNLPHFSLLSHLVSDTPAPPLSIPLLRHAPPTPPSAAATPALKRHRSQSPSDSSDEYKAATTCTASSATTISTPSDDGRSGGGGGGGGGGGDAGSADGGAGAHALKRLKRSTSLALLAQITQQLGVGAGGVGGVGGGGGGGGGGMALGHGIGMVDNVQAAITTLQNDYDMKMSVEDLVVGLSVFESEHKAKMFVAMKKGLVRDAWLMKEIRVYRGERGGDL